MLKASASPASACLDVCSHAFTILSVQFSSVARSAEEEGTEKKKKTTKKQQERKSDLAWGKHDGDFGLHLWSIWWKASPSPLKP